MVMACRESNSPQSQWALEELCRAYWYPIYAFLRRKGQSRDDAQELTQTFFLKVVEKGFFEKAEPERGRLRSFLLKSVQNHLTSARRKANSLSMKVFPALGEFDFESGETRYQSEASTTETAEQLFERKWALALLAGVLESLREELTEKFGSDHADLMVGQLNFAEDQASIAELSSQIGVSDTAMKARLHRMRQRYRELLRSAVASTLGPGEEVNDEIQRLLKLVRIR